MLIPLNILNVSKIRILFFIVVTEPIYNLVIISNYIIIKSLDKNSVYEEDEEEDQKEDEEEEKDDDEMDDEPLLGDSPHY